MTATDRIRSLVRTVVPLFYAWLVDVGLPATFSEELSGLVALVITGAIYYGLRRLEEVWPVIGILLGWKGAPAYEPAPTDHSTG